MICKKSVRGICKAGQEYEVLGKHTFQPIPMIEPQELLLIEYGSSKRRTYVKVDVFYDIKELRREKLRKLLGN